MNGIVGGAYERLIVRVVVLDVGGEGLLGAEDGAAEIGLLDRLVLDADDEQGVRVWDAEADYRFFWIRGV